MICGNLTVLAEIQMYDGYGGFLDFSIGARGLAGQDRGVLYSSLS